MASSHDLSSNQGSNQNSEEASRLSKGRVVGYIPPDDFLMSLLADKPHSASSFQKTAGCKNRSSLDTPVSSNSRAGCKDRTVLNLPVSCNTRAAKKRRIVSQEELAGNLLLPHTDIQNEFPSLFDLENTECYPEINIVQVQEVAITRCGISPSEVSAERLLDSTAGSSVGYQ